MLKILLLFLVFTSVGMQEMRPVVVLKQGMITGVKVYLSRVTINAFLGIPYAEPPVGKLRFQVPERHKGWQGTFFAGNYGSLCPYYISNFDMNEKEDCLFLNIWTYANSNTKTLFPVIVYLNADPVQIPGHDLAAEGVVLVTVSYRQNIFGSFCLGGSEARGNLGLLDQYLALLWVKDNIESFGGDKNSVTLIGHMKSASSVIYHMTSPRSRGLFHKVVIMSGNSFSPWNQEDPMEISLKVRSDLGCVTNSIRSSMECLQMKTVQEILRAYKRHTNDHDWSILPAVDIFLHETDRYLPDNPYELLKNGTYLQIPMLVGSTDHITDFWEQKDQNYNQLRHSIEENEVPNILKIYKFDGPNKNLIKSMITWKYIGSVENGDTNRLTKQLHDLRRDTKILAPIDRILKLLITTSGQPIYSYYLHLSKSTVNVTESTIGGELLLLFGPQLLQQFSRRRFTSDEEVLSRKLKSSFVGFAKKGNPSISDLDDHWRPYNSLNKYIEQFIENNDLHNVSELRSDITFWNDLLPRLTTMLSQTNTLPQEYQISPDPAAGFRNAMYTLVGLVVALLILLLICVVLLKRKIKERKGGAHLSMTYH